MRFASLTSLFTLIREALRKSLSFLSQQARHESNQYNTNHPKSVGRLNQRLLEPIHLIQMLAARILWAARSFRQKFLSLSMWKRVASFIVIFLGILSSIITIISYRGFDNALINQINKENYPQFKELVTSNSLLYPGIQNDLVNNSVMQNILNPAKNDEILTKAEGSSLSLTPEGRSSLHRLRADYYFKIGKGENGLTELQEALKLSEEPVVLGDLGRGYMYNERYDEALYYINLARTKAKDRKELNLWSTELECTSANILFYLGDQFSQKDALEKCLKGPVRTKIPIAGHGQRETLAMLLMADFKFDQAEEIIKPLVTPDLRNDAFPSTAEVMGFIEVSKGNFGAARQWFEKSRRDYCMISQTSLWAPGFLEDCTRSNVNLVIVDIAARNFEELPKHLQRIKTLLERSQQNQCLPGTALRLIDAAILAHYIGYKEELQQLFQLLLKEANKASPDPNRCLPPQRRGTFLMMLRAECGDDQSCLKNRALDTIAAFDVQPHVSQLEMSARDEAIKLLDRLDNDNHERPELH